MNKITMNDEELKALYEEWLGVIEELRPVMAKIIVRHPRIKDYTMIEEWRTDHGYNPFDAEMDRDLWKNTYDMFFEVYDEDELRYYRDICRRCSLDEGAMKLKYPRVAKLFGTIE